MGTRASAVAAWTQRASARGDEWSDGPERLRTRYAWGVVVPFVVVVALSTVAGGHARLFLFVPVLGVAAVALLAGVGPAILATLLSLAGSAYLIFDPTRSLAVSSPFDALRLAGLGLLSLVMAWGVGALREAYRRVARHKAELERAVRLRDEVLAVVSHDLKAPLGTIRLSGDALVRLATRTPEVARHATRVISAAEQMDRLIHDLLDAASIDAGRLSVHRAPESAGDVAREALERIRAAADAASVRLALATPDAALPLACDRQRILQALGNLLVNAVNATAPGGSVSLEVRSAGEAVVFAVRDSGHGIDPADLPHLFDRFRRGRASRHRGSGLGLTIAKGIAEAHGGTIRVESRPGEGALFELLVPRHAGA